MITPMRVAITGVKVVAMNSMLYVAGARWVGWAAEVEEWR